MGHVLHTLGRTARSLPDVWLLVLGLAIDLMLWGGDATLRWGGRLPTLLVIATGVATFVVLANRRRHPFLAFGCAAVYTCFWAVVLLTYQPFVGLLIALFEIARRYPTRTALTFLTISVIPLLANTFDTVINSNAGFGGVLATMAVWCTMTGIVWAVGREARRSAVLARLREEKLAVEAEVALQAQRLRVARDLHDIVAHSVTMIVLQAAGAQRLQHRDDARLSELLVSIESTGQQAMSELRHMLRVLRPSPTVQQATSSPLGPGEAPILEVLRGGSPGLAQLPTLVEHVRSAGLDINVTVAGNFEPRKDAERDLIAYRVVQEALTNASKHAGPGSRCDVQVIWIAEGLTIQVTDDGAGTPADGTGSSGLGLSGLRERLTAIGGTLNVGTHNVGAVSGRPGYRATAWMPWPTDSLAQDESTLIPPVPSPSLADHESGLQGA